MSTAPLPEGWLAYEDGHGQTYYANAATGESSYSHPGAPNDLPEGWAAYTDQHGRSYFANAATGETSWEKPQVAPAAASAAAAVPAGEWTTEQTYSLGGPGCEHLFQGKVTLLDQTWCSVVTTVEALASGTIAVDVGYCVLFSQSKQQYYLLWRSDKEAEAFAQVDLGDQQHAEAWSTSQVIALGGEGNEHTFDGRAHLLDRAHYSSVSAAVDALNAGSEPDLGYCVVFSQSQQTYYLLYRADKEIEALNALGIPEGA